MQKLIKQMRFLTSVFKKSEHTEGHRGRQNALSQEILP